MSTTQHAGAFVSLEGPDCSGKTTNVEWLCRALREEGFRKVIQTRQPGGSEVAEHIREAILGKMIDEHMDPTVETMLYAASRLQVLNMVIKPAVADGWIVVSDRWADSSFAYQGYGRGMMREYEAMDHFIHQGFDFYEPDVTLFFDISLEESFKRLYARKKEYNRLNAETETFKKRCYDGYMAARSKNGHRFRSINAMLPIEEVRNSLQDWIVKEFKPRYSYLLEQ